MSSPNWRRQDALSRLEALNDARNALARELRHTDDGNDKFAAGVRHALDCLDRLSLDQLNRLSLLVDEMFESEGEVGSA